ncbi:hypothetical protein GGQ94_000012 [Petrimonas sulfuriphila]|jgi:hypothetical protein
MALKDYYYSRNDNCEDTPCIISENSKLCGLLDGALFLKESIV